MLLNRLGCNVQITGITIELIITKV